MMDRSVDEILDGDEENDDGQCNSTIRVGPDHDPYGSECELEWGHDGPHRGPDPFGNDGHVEWEGGGYCAGDPLPIRNLRHVA